MSQRSVEQPRSSLRALFTPLVCASLAALCSAEDGARTVDFQREVRPLLTERCYGCHGPDAATREADLRLDRREHALAQRLDVCQRDGIVEDDEAVSPQCVESHLQLLRTEAVALQIILAEMQF